MQENARAQVYTHMQTTRTHEDGERDGCVDESGSNFNGIERHSEERHGHEARASGASDPLFSLPGVLLRFAQLWEATKTQPEKCPSAAPE